MTVSCAGMADLVDELALDVLPGDQRAEALEHLEGCPACRERLDALSEVADQLLLACQSVEPPAGFEDRVLARLRPGRSRPRRRGLWMAVSAAGVAATVLIGALIGVGGLRLTRHGSPSPAAEARPGALRTVALVANGGRRIGDVSAYAGPPAWIFLRVHNGQASGTYQCVIDVAGGRTIPVGTMWVSDGNGGWGENVSVDVRQVRSARLLDPNGVTVATATFA